MNVLSMDDYVKGVVPREMPASWDPDAVRSQAVAARTYAAFDRAAHPTRSYQTCDTTSCQVYGGVGAEDSRGNAAVVATADQVLNYRGKPAFTQFGSSSGGWLAAGSQPYLVAKADPYDGWSGNGVHTWSTTITRTAIQRAWPSLGTLQPGAGDAARRARRVVRPGGEDGPRRHEGQRDAHRHHLPVEVRAALAVVPVRHGSTGPRGDDRTDQPRRRRRSRRRRSRCAGGPSAAATRSSAAPPPASTPSRPAAPVASSTAGSSTAAAPARTSSTAGC